LNGSTFPKLKQAGDPILAGSVSEDGVFTVKCLSPYVPRKIQAVNHPLFDPVKFHSVSPSNHGAISLLVFAMAVAGATVAVIVSGGSAALILVSTILILGASLTWVSGVPIHLWTGLVHLEKRGLYGKSPEIIRDIATVNVSFFGKTGVMSREELVMERFFVMPVFQDREDWIMSIVYQTSRMVHHPLVNSLSNIKSLIKEEPIKEDLRYEIVSGLGVKVSLTDGLGQQVVFRIGESDFVLGPGGESRVSAILEEHDLTLGKRIWISLDHRICAIATLKESWTVAPQPFFAQLELLGVKPAVLTGDNAFNNARLDGLSLFQGLSSIQKQEHVIQEVEAGGSVLYVGDGLNDFRAMSNSHVSIAMSHSPDPVLNSASAVLKSGHLTTVLFAISYCRRIVGISKRNAWVFPCAFTLTSIMAIAGWITPIVATLYVMGCFFLVWLQSFLLGSSSLSSVVEKTRYRKVSKREAPGRYVRNR
jgi:cation transport ATPase